MNTAALAAAEKGLLCAGAVVLSLLAAREPAVGDGGPSARLQEICISGTGVNSGVYYRVTTGW